MSVQERWLQQKNQVADTLRELKEQDDPFSTVGALVVCNTQMLMEIAESLAVILTKLDELKHESANAAGEQPTESGTTQASENGEG